MFVVVHTYERKKANRGCAMPHNGETNKRFGFYENLCCGKEIVVPEGSQFPDCPNHPRLTTIWKTIIDHAVDKFPRSSAQWTPHFKVGDRIRIVAPAKEKGNHGSVVKIVEGFLDHIHRYHVRLDNGTLLRCFGFELEFVRGETLKCA